MKQKRSLEDAERSLAQVGMQLGFLTFQIEHVIPKDIQKHINEMQDLNNEVFKLREKAHMDKLAEHAINPEKLATVSPIHTEPEVVPV